MKTLNSMGAKLNGFTVPRKNKFRSNHQAKVFEADSLLHGYSLL